MGSLDQFRQQADQAKKAETAKRKEEWARQEQETNRRNEETAKHRESEFQERLGTLRTIQLPKHLDYTSNKGERSFNVISWLIWQTGDDYWGKCCGSEASLFECGKSCGTRWRDHHHSTSCLNRKFHAVWNMLESEGLRVRMTCSIDGLHNHRHPISAAF